MARKKLNQTDGEVEHDIEDSQAVMEFKEKWRLMRKTRNKRLVLTFLMIAAISTGMVFIFIAFGLNPFSDPEDFDPSSIGGGTLTAAILIYLFIFVLESATMNMIPGTTTFFISGVAAGLFAPGDQLLQINYFLRVFAICVLGIFLSSMVLYAMGRYGGRRLLYWLFGKEAIEGKLDWIARNGTKGVPWLFLIPFFPTDLMCIVCGASKMKFWQFMLIVLVFRPLEVLLLLMYRIVFLLGLWDTFTTFEMIVLINLVVLNTFLLWVYHKALLKLVNRFTGRQKYKQQLEAAIRSAEEWERKMALEENPEDVKQLELTPEMQEIRAQLRAELIAEINHEFKIISETALAAGRKKKIKQV